jgi:hypothetical protein
VNDFAPGTAFGSILITGGYNLTGNDLLLHGSVTSEGTGNAFAITVQFSGNGGFAQTVAGTFTVSGAWPRQPQPGAERRPCFRHHVDRWNDLWDREA